MSNVKLGFVAGLILVIFCSSAYASAIARELAIISNEDFPSSSLTKTVVKEIYLGEKMAEGSTKIKPMENKDKAINRKFMENIMSSSVDGYKAYWLKRFFQEGITPPAAKASSTAVIQAVDQTPGGIGFVWADEVTGSAGVKVLLTIEVGD